MTAAAEDKPRTTEKPPAGRLTPEERSAFLAVRGKINSTVSFGTVDGPGIRYVLFLQGCPLRCLYCHNPDSVCGDGMGFWTAEKALSEILRFRPFLQNGGVTFSGGEPLMQPDFVYALCRLLREEGLHTAIDTSGCLPPESVSRTIDAADLIILDIKAFDPVTAKKLTGQDSRQAFATLDYCEKTGKQVWIRHVLVRDYTLDETQLTGLAEYLKKFRCIQDIELLPFHQYGAEKWKQIGRPYLLAGLLPTTPHEAEWAREIFARAGLRAH